MSDVAKPGNGDAPSAPASQDAPATPPAPAEPTVALSDDQKAYLKGIGIEDVNSPEAIQKILDTSIKQKSSVSKTSRELEELKARLASQGKPTDVQIEDEAPEDEPTGSAPQADATPQGGSDTPPAASNGVSDNDLFDLSRMFNEFPELSDEAQDGRIFGELRQLGYFGTNGINKQAIYNHLSAKNAQAKELRELREFKEKYSKPDPSNNPQPSSSLGVNLNGEMNRDVARAVILKGPQADRYDEARQFLQKNL